MNDHPVAPDADDARQAAAIPTFSTGTAAIGKDGKPIVPAKQVEAPAFTEGSVAIPEGTETTGGAPAPTSKEAILAAHQARVVPEVAPPAESVAGQEAGGVAAEAVAEQIADAFADMEEFEWEDPDLSTDDTPVKIPIRVPKQFADVVKRGYGRRGALDRALSYAKNADPVLRNLIENGQINQILPLLQRALSDQAFGEYVYQGYDRATKGLPLIEQAKIEAAASAAPAPAADLGFEDDPFFAERVRPLTAKLESFEQRFRREDEERQQATQRQQQVQRQNEQRALEMKYAHEDLARAYPNHVRLDLGPNDPFWKKAIDQAKQAGYVDSYGARAGIVFGGQLAMQIDSERLAATGSPTADALRAAEAQHGELARREAAAAARTVGAGAAMHAAPPPRPKKPSSWNADGTLKERNPAQHGERDDSVHFGFGRLTVE